MCWLETLSFSTGRNFESNAKNYHFRAAQSTCGSRAQRRRWWDVHLVLCFACSDQPRAAEASSAGSRRNLAANPSCATGGRRLRSRLHLPTVNCSWILRLHLHGQEPKDDLGIRCPQAESLAVPALPFFFSPSSFAFMNLFHKLPLLTASHLCQALAHLILPLVVFLSSGQGYFLAASSAKMPIC